ncbi:hypothetical protein M0802_015582 [Mischocyttarus mexicanus]|nr:hypothetical protein M0802_015582 [Mischocyttarus mexicanus]
MGQKQSNEVKGVRRVASGLRQGLPLQKGVRILLQPTPAGRKRRPMGSLNITMTSDFRYHSWSEGIHSAAVQDGVLTGHSSSTTLDCQSTTVGNLAVGMVKATGA